MLRASLSHFLKLTRTYGTRVRFEPDRDGCNAHALALDYATRIGAISKCHI